VFSSVADYVREALGGHPSGRVSPLEVAAHLDSLSHEASTRNRSIRSLGDVSPDVRRWTVDVAILAALGGFFAGKIRSSVWFELYASTGNAEAISLAVDEYAAARDALVGASNSASVYVDDLTFGPQRRLRGHWRDRLPAIEADLEDMKQRLSSATGRSSDHSDIDRLRHAASGPPQDVEIVHEAPERFAPGVPIALSVTLGGAGAANVRDVELRHRPMNQALSVSVERMRRSGGAFVGTIPPSAADGTFAVQYAFVLRDRRGHAWREPGLGPELASQPYFVLRSRSS
jgi:hypothetical protein